MIASVSLWVSNIIVGLSGLGVGLGLYLGARNAIDATHEHGTKRAKLLGFVLLRLGTSMIVGLIATLIFGHVVNVNWRTYVYAVALILISAGAGLVLVAEAKDR